MRALVEGGADPSATNEGRLSIPRNREDRESYTPKVVSGFESSVQAAIRGDSTRSRYYVQPNPDPAGEKQLALAAVIAAAEHGVDLNHRDFSESTALHDAAARKTSEHSAGVGSARRRRKCNQFSRANTARYGCRRGEPE